MIFFLFKSFIFSKLDDRVKRHNILGIVGLVPDLRVMGSNLAVSGVAKKRLQSTSFER